MQLLQVSTWFTQVGRQDEMDQLHSLRDLPDLTPANFYLWGHPKSIVYTKQCNTRDELWNAIEVAGTTIYSYNMADALQMIRNSQCNRARLCTDYNCGPFWHLL
jgi:hypothetical protein